MKKIVIFFLLMLICLAFSACGSTPTNGKSEIINDENKELPKLAVMEFEDKSGKISQSMLSAATEHIRSKFVSSNKFIVIAKERQENTLIKQMKKESYKLCNDKNCQIPLGQALSADTILRTTISFFGDSFTITSELIDLEKEATTKGAETTFDGSEKSLKEAIASIVAQIFGKEIPKVSATATVNSEPDKKPRSNKTEDLQWSNKAFVAFWSDAVNYCKKLNENSYNDWRLPNIDELRTLIKNCSKTETGGECKVSEQNGCLADKCSSPATSCYCEMMDNDDGYYSTLGDNGKFCSSSIPSGHSNDVWYINFDDGKVSYDNKILCSNVRCVRNKN